MGKKSERRERRTAAAKAREAEARGALIEERRRQRAAADAAADRAAEARLAGEPSPAALGARHSLGRHRALLALAMLGLSGLPRDPGEG